MKLWIVYEYDEEEFSNAHLFTTKEKAEAYYRKYGSTTPEEIEVDEDFEPLPGNSRVFMVQGTLNVFPNVCCPESFMENTTYPVIQVYERGTTIIGLVTVRVIAENEAEATAKAVSILNEWKAKNR